LPWAKEFLEQAWLWKYSALFSKLNLKEGGIRPGFLKSIPLNKSEPEVVKAIE